MHKDFADRHKARVPSARLLEAQCPSGGRNWKNVLDRAGERPADAPHTGHCTLEEVVHTLVVDIGSLAWRKLIAQLIVLAPVPVLELLGQPFVYSQLPLAAVVGHQGQAACSRKSTSGS